MGGVIWHGLEEYERELADFPADVDAHATAIVTSTTDAAAAEMRATYPVITGHLRDSLQVRPAHDTLRPSIQIENTAEYAVPFEYGAHGRRHPAGRVFVPIYFRMKRALAEQLARLLVDRYGAARVRGAR